MGKFIGLVDRVGLSRNHGRCNPIKESPAANTDYLQTK